MSRERWNATRPDEWFEGSPELVVEVLSPSNTASEMLDRQKTCMRGGCREFWVVDPKLLLVRVTTADGRDTIYEAGAVIPLDIVGGGALPAVSIFQD